MKPAKSKQNQIQWHTSRMDANEHNNDNNLIMVFGYIVIHFNFERKKHEIHIKK